MKMGKWMKGRKADKHNAWKGGRPKTGMGYIMVYCPSHPYCNSRGYVLEHRLVMEKHLGRTLLPAEVVHHISGIKTDNRIPNLMLFASGSDHKKFHYPKGFRIGGK